jgi:hypothetical protein
MSAHVRPRSLAREPASSPHATREDELITDPEIHPAPPHIRFVERRIAGVTQYLRMRGSLWL